MLTKSNTICNAFRRIHTARWQKYEQASWANTSGSKGLRPLLWKRSCSAWYTLDFELFVLTTFSVHFAFSGQSSADEKPDAFDVEHGFVVDSRSTCASSRQTQNAGAVTALITSWTVAVALLLFISWRPAISPLATFSTPHLHIGPNSNATTLGCNKQIQQI